MINTLDIKRKLYDGFFHVGDKNSKDVVLMTGSCRGVPHLNFLSQWNEAHGNPFSIYYINPVDYHWDKDDKEQDVTTALAAAARNPVLLDILKRVKIFIHEHFERWGQFNTEKDNPENIYQLGLQPEKDICLPNWHCRFILFQDIVDMDAEAKAKAKACGGTLSKEVIKEFGQMGDDSMAKWKEICKLTSFPEFADYFEEHRIQKRFFHNYSHVSVNFTVPLFRMMAEKHLGIQVGDGFIEGLYAVDMYANHGVKPLTRYDIAAHGWMWPEEIKELDLS